MTLTLNPRKILGVSIGGALVVLLALAAYRLVDLQAMAAPSPAPAFLAIDPDALLRTLIEERALDLEGDDLARAVRKFDLVIADEAARLHAEYGLPIVKADLLFAGGMDYTEAFAQRVLQQWDLLP